MRYKQEGCRYKQFARRYEKSLRRYERSSPCTSSPAILRAIFLLYEHSRDFTSTLPLIRALTRFYEQSSSYTSTSTILRAIFLLYEHFHDFTSSPHLIKHSQSPFIDKQKPAIYHSKVVAGFHVYLISL
ncbi:hypothetical protein [Sporosarcina cyprini]|uniref:hypothetical protein n=1 Tax=Sporosarcina cyprini TaxID=2910523 RepID=UPI001EDCF367|nr:hypothetical protein [Sporosarcina cyprini]MCG3088032.1 hypothetical protein [Sporosarcina cyprini]